MRAVAHAGMHLFLDLASTVLFLAVVLVTKNVHVAVSCGIALGIAQIGWRLARSEPIDIMQRLSLVAVIGSGVATLMSEDPRFVMIKPTLIYFAASVIMLKPGWMNRYLPPSTQEGSSSVAVAFGFAWAGLMFASAALNLVVALTCSLVAWSAIMTTYGIVSKAVLIAIQCVSMQRIRNRNVVDERSNWRSRALEPSTTRYF
jgi:intracellular septation protein